jgi:hypothetical protein
VFGPGGAVGVDPGQFFAPVAFQAVDEPPQLEDAFGPDGVG